MRNELDRSTSPTNKCFEPQCQLRILTDRSKSVLLLWFITVLCLYVGDLFHFPVLLQQTWV